MARSGIVTRRWTAEEDALLKRLLEEGETRPVIAARLKRTMAACEHRVGFLRDQGLIALSFREYLANRRTRYTPGSEDFLRTLARDDNFAAVATRHELDAYLRRSDIPTLAKIYARQVWNGYVMVKKRRDRPPAGLKAKR